MRGKYHMMDWEQQRWKYIITKAIEKMEKTPDYTEDLTQQDICPANIRQTLESIGWEEIGFDTNGWQNDTWYFFSHPDYDFEIVLYYEGITFDHKLYRRYED